MTPMLGIMASQISGHLWAPSGAYDSIATVSVGSGGSSSATFTSIPSTYTHLQIRCVMSHSNGAVSPGIYLEANGDTTAANYYSHRLIGNGSAASSTSNALALIGSNMNTSITSQHNLIIDILDYTNTNKYKTLRSLGGYEDNSIGTVNMTSELWMNTAAITSIVISNKSDNWNQYSSFALYGIKGA